MNLYRSLALFALVALFQPHAQACSVSADSPFFSPLSDLVARTKTIVVARAISSEPEYDWLIFRSDRARWKFEATKVLKGKLAQNSFEIPGVRPIAVGSAESSRSYLDQGCEPRVSGFKPGESYVIFLGVHHDLNFKSSDGPIKGWMEKVNAELDKQHN